MDPARRGFLRGRPPPAARPLLRGIGEQCLALQRVECRICGEACGEGAIRFRPTLGNVAQPQLDTQRCTGCGDCIAPCPTQALQLR